MTRAQFLNDLYRRLTGNGMDPGQAEQHLTYYAEMLADRMEEGMTEDQAVASLEDVDTAARRLLEEEGLSYREALAPARSYKAPRRWSQWRQWTGWSHWGRWPVRWAAWALAAAVALGAVGRQLFSGNARQHQAAIPEAVAATETPVVEDRAAPVAETTPYTEDSAYLDAPYQMGYEYTGGELRFPCQDASKIDIQWVSGTVFVQCWSGEEVLVQEYAYTPLNERTAMSCQTDGNGKLSIRYRERLDLLDSVKGSKWLTVLVPDGLLDSLNIETASAGALLTGLETGELSASTVSGEISANGCYVRSARLSSTSGDVSWSGGEAIQLEGSTVSGDVWLNLEGRTEAARLATTSGDMWLNLEDEAAQSITVESVSGDVALSLPYGLGFSLDYGTVSGDFSDGLGLEDGVYNGGGCKIEVDTVSGSLEIY